MLYHTLIINNTIVRESVISVALRMIRFVDLNIKGAINWILKLVTTGLIKPSLSPFEQLIRLVWYLLEHSSSLLDLYASCSEKQKQNELRHACVGWCWSRIGMKYLGEGYWLMFMDITLQSVWEWKMAAVQ